MKDFWNTGNNLKNKKINKKRIIIIVIIVIILALILSAGIVYLKNRTVQLWVDKNIFRKEVSENNLPSIEIEEVENTEVYAFYKYIGVLKENIFSIYDSIGNKTNELNLEVTNPIFCTNNRCLVVAENEGQKVYLITDKDITWEKTVEGNIAKIDVNRNGYVAVTVVGTSHKSVVILFDNQGNSLFKTFLSSTRVTSTSISNDNKYLALAEVDTSGTVVKSSIKVMDIEKGKNDPDNSIKDTYDTENGELVINIKYQDKDRLVCMYADKIDVIKLDKEVETIYSSENKKISFSTVELIDSAVTIEEKTSGLFTADSIVNIINTDNNGIITYSTDSITKELLTYGNKIALNLGSEVEFINTSGWLIKDYMAEQEITKIVVSSSIAGIVYRDRIEVINL